MIRSFALLSALILNSLAMARASQSIVADDMMWDSESAKTLIAAIDGIGAEGIDRDRYELSALQDALKADDAIAVNIASSAIFAQVAADLAQGTIPAADRRRWFIDGSRTDEAAVGEAMQRGLKNHAIGDALHGFAPEHPQYRALRAALATLPPDDRERRARLRLNMERWRWMPKDLGVEYILINIPAFELAVVRDGETIDRRRIIAGAANKPTPQFAATAGGVIFNPTWYVPDSIADEGIAALLTSNPLEAERLGYYVGAEGGVRQKPGPKNALGRVKLDMPNGYSIFVHDTPAQSLFDRESRALSHGCIRVESALSFVRAILPAWDEETIAGVVSRGMTVRAELEHPIPVYVAYFTAVADAEGSVTFYRDVYGLDKQLLPKFGAPARGVASLHDILAETCPAEAG